MTSNSCIITDVVKLTIVLIIIILAYRLLTQNSNINEGFAINSNMPDLFGNLVPHNNISYSDGNNNIAVIELAHKHRLESLVIDIDVDDSATENTTAIIHHVKIKDESELGSNMINNDQGDIEHQLIENNNGHMRLKIYNINTANGDKPVTDAISITLNGGEPFKVKNVWVYGMDPNAISRAALANDLSPISAVEKTSAIDHDFKKFERFTYKLENLSLISIISLNVSLASGYKPRDPPQFEVHYKGVDDGAYKVDTAFYLTDMNLEHTPHVPLNIFLPNAITAKELYIRMLSSAVTGLSEERFIGKELKTDTFRNTTQKKKKEKFAGGYSADDMCPSLDAMEDKIQLTDQICARLEYNDKIKNERIKLERTKQYISKLKEQDEEIKKLENVITSLQDKREKRDITDDALRLAQYDKQRKHVAAIQDLAQKRDKLRRNNVVNVQLNLKNKPVTQPTQTST